LPPLGADIHVIAVPLVTGAQIQFSAYPGHHAFLAKTMVQDNHRFLWLSAADGLRRYDSYGFMRVRIYNPNSIASSLPSPAERPLGTDMDQC
jgi:hypothetical protein